LTVNLELSDGSIQLPTKVYGGADVNLHTSQTDFEVEMFFVASCSFCSRKPCYRTFWILKPILFVENWTPLIQLGVKKVVIKLPIDVKYFNP